MSPSSSDPSLPPSNADGANADGANADGANADELAALRQSEGRLRALVERAAFGVFRCDAEGRLADANAALAAMLGRGSAAALLGVDFERDILAGDGDRGRWREAVATGDASDWLDLRCRRPGGVTVRVRATLTVERDAAGRPIAVLGLAENVTERMQREEVLRRGERMASLGRTLAGVTHEINNPLAAIIGFAQILLKGERRAGERHALETILGEARRAARVVKDMLNIARREESVEKQRVSLNEIVRYILDTQRYAIETRGIESRLELAPALPPIVADVAQIEQVVLNLVVNAWQALDMAREHRQRVDPAWRPELRVETALESGMVRLRVTDNGPGVDAVDLPHIFDPFWTTKEEGEGTGLGLSVVHGIVSSHGGRIDVTSVPDTATTFTLTFGAAAPSAPVAASSERRAANGSDARDGTAPLDVLVIDDETAICEILSRYLSARGHAVITANSGEKALRLAEHAGFDVVISDLRMPGIDGREVIRRLRLLPTFAHTRFLLSTGDFAATERLQDGRSQDGTILVEKPYDMDTLLSLVEDDVRPATER